MSKPTYYEEKVNYFVDLSFEGLRFILLIFIIIFLIPFYVMGWFGKKYYKLFIRKKKEAKQ